MNCDCSDARRSDCRAGDRCIALAGGIVSSHRPVYAAARIVFACGVTCGAVVLVKAIMKLWSAL